MNEHNCDHQFLANDPQIKKNSIRATLVFWLTVVTMVFEIYFGIISGSMALLADGWHMGTHAAALGITILTYKLAMSPKLVQNFNFGGGKLIPLGGFASAVFLFLVAIYVVIEAIGRFLEPTEIKFDEALVVATLGLIINIVSAFILKPDDLPGHHHHSHGGGDHNIRGAYLHVIADALTSVAAIVALLAGRFYGLNWLDPVIGIVSSLVIAKWALGLLKDTGWELLDGHAKGIDYNHMRSRIESTGAKIQDLHVWKIGPSAIACELVVMQSSPKGLDTYRNILMQEFAVSHVVIEELS